MSQIDYQPSQSSSFNPALAFAPQTQSHSGGQSYLSRNPLGQQPFPQAPYPGPQKQQQLNGVGGFNLAAAGVNANINGALSNNISQQQLGGQHLAFSSAPYSQSASTSTTAGGPLGATHSAASFHGTSPQRTGFGQFSPQSQMQQPAMAPPPTLVQGNPQTPARSQSQPQSPRSPANVAREKERLELLLDINSDLLQEMQNLQAQGKGGAPTPEIQAILKKQGHNVQLGSEEFIQVTQRVHANLGYLCGASDHALKPNAKQAPHPPNYVHAPPSMPQLVERYSKLRGLFPGWAGVDGPAVPQSSEMHTGVNAMGF